MNPGDREREQRDLSVVQNQADNGGERRRESGQEDAAGSRGHERRGRRLLEAVDAPDDCGSHPGFDEDRPHGDEDRRRGERAKDLGCRKAG